MGVLLPQPLRRRPPTTAAAAVQATLARLTAQLARDPAARVTIAVGYDADDPVLRCSRTRAAVSAAVTAGPPPPVPRCRRMVRDPDVVWARLPLPPPPPSPPEWRVAACRALAREAYMATSTTRCSVAGGTATSRSWRRGGGRVPGPSSRWSTAGTSTAALAAAAQGQRTTCRGRGTRAAG